MYILVQGAQCVSQPTLWLFPQFLECIVGIDIIRNQQNPTFGSLCCEVRATMEKSSSTLKSNTVFLEELQMNHIIKNLKDAEIVILSMSPFSSPVRPLQQTDISWKMIDKLNQVLTPNPAAVPDSFFTEENQHTPWYAALDLLILFLYIC